MHEQAGYAQDVLETPSGKEAADENFPVGSWLIAPELRPHVAKYYAFARATDDIADNPDLAPGEKIRRLDAFDAGFEPNATGPVIATRLRDSMHDTGVSDRCARDLLIAFRQDALKTRYANWSELLDYCASSAHPVGRYLLQLHGEAPTTEPTGDALCAALQVLNHLQDIGDDRRTLDRIYLPRDWMAAAGVDDSAFEADTESPELRQVIDRCLDGCEELLTISAPLASMVRSRRLAAEIAVIQRLAHCLAARLRNQDPLAHRVEHSKINLAQGLGAGLIRFLTHRRNS